jgi:thiamine biosynthesis lipoprotein ApbE
MHLKNVLFATATLFAVLWLYSDQRVPKLFREDRVVFETVVSVKIHSSEPDLAKFTEMAFNSFVLVDSLMSSYKTSSEISHVSSNPTVWVDCSIETYEVLQRAKYWALKTIGAYDPTVG